MNNEIQHERIGSETWNPSLYQRKRLDKTFAGYLINKGYSSTTIASYAHMLGKFKEWAENENLPIDQTTYRDILVYIKHLQSTCSQKTVQINTNALNRYFSFMEKTGRIETNPVRPVDVKGVHRRKLYDILSREELDELYHGFPMPNPDDLRANQNWFENHCLTAKRNKVIVGLLVFQGLNITELKRLNVADIDLPNGVVFISGGRRSNERTLQLQSFQVFELHAYMERVRPQILAMNEKQADLLLVSTGKGNRLDNALGCLQKTLHSHFPKVKSYYQIRASVLTDWLKVYGLRHCQSMAGHRFVSSTEAFQVNDLEGLQEDVDRFGL